MLADFLARTQVLKAGKPELQGCLHHGMAYPACAWASGPCYMQSNALQ